MTLEVLMSRMSKVSPDTGARMGLARVLFVAAPLAAMLMGCNALHDDDGSTSNNQSAPAPSPAPSPGSAPSPAPAPTSTGTATIRWNGGSDPTIASYRVYYGTTPGQYLQARGLGISVTGASYTVANLQTGIRYYFTATAVDSSNNESAYGQEVSKLIQ